MAKQQKDRRAQTPPRGGGRVRNPDVGGQRDRGQRGKSKGRKGPGIQTPGSRAHFKDTGPIHVTTGAGKPTQAPKQKRPTGPALEQAFKVPKANPKEERTTFADLFGRAQDV